MELYTQEKLDYENAVAASWEAKDARRYLWLRQLNVPQFKELYRRSIEEGQSFDAMVDNHIATKTFPVGRP